MKVIFLDRDGTLIKNIPYLGDPNLVQLEHRVIPALRLLQEQGYKFIVVTNQSGIARGLITEEDFKLVQENLIDQLSQKELFLLDTYFCPYHPSEGKGDYLKDSEDRKPKPGMLLKAIEKYKISIENSFMVGDSFSDIKAGQKAGVKSILVRTGHGQTELNELKEELKADYIAEDLYDAVVNYIIND